MSSLPEAGDRPHQLKAVEKGAKLAKGNYVADSLKGSVTFDTGVLHVRTDVDAEMKVTGKGAVILIEGGFKGTIEALCPFTIVIGNTGISARRRNPWRMLENFGIPI